MSVPVLPTCLVAGILLHLFHLGSNVISMSRDWNIVQVIWLVNFTSALIFYISFFLFLGFLCLFLLAKIL